MTLKLAGGPTQKIQFSEFYIACFFLVESECLYFCLYMYGRLFS